jgi:hypothetical protein
MPHVTVTSTTTARPTTTTAGTTTRMTSPVTTEATVPTSGDCFFNLYVETGVVRIEIQQLGVFDLSLSF